MFTAIVPAKVEGVDQALAPALKNPAVAQCHQVREQVYRMAMKKKRGGVCALIDADEAYCHAMPPLIGYENICDFIACVSYGLLIRALAESTCTSMLYAAQVALSTIAPPSKTQRRDTA
jgi:hypothetical protein